MEDIYELCHRFVLIIHRGQSGALLESQSSDVFQMKVGNIPGHSMALIKLKYVTELMNDEDSIRFILPTTIAPRYNPFNQVLKFPNLHLQFSSFSHNLKHTFDKQNALSLSMNCDMKTPIIGISCPTHTNLVGKCEGDKASVHFNMPTAMDRDIVINIHTKGKNSINDTNDFGRIEWRSIGCGAVLRRGSGDGFYHPSVHFERHKTRSILRGGLQRFNERSQDGTRKTGTPIYVKVQFERPLQRESIINHFCVTLAS